MIDDASGGVVSGLLDFEFVAYDWRVMELAVALSKYVGEDAPLPLIRGERGGRESGRGRERERVTFIRRGEGGFAFGFCCGARLAADYCWRRGAGLPGCSYVACSPALNRPMWCQTCMHTHAHALNTRSLTHARTQNIPLSKTTPEFVSGYAQRGHLTPAELEALPDCINLR